MNKEEIIIKDTIRLLPHFNRYVKNKRVLDIGCGSGLGATYISNKCNSKFHLLDCEDLRYKKAKKLPFTLGSVEKLPFKNKEFDTSIMSYVLHHINKKISVKRVFSEALRVANRLIIIEETCTKRTDFKKALKIDKKFNKILHPKSTFSFTGYYTDAEIKDMLKNIGASFISRKLSTGSIKYGGLDIYIYIASKRASK